MAPPRKWTPEIVAEALRMRDGGLEVAEILHRLQMRHGQQFSERQYFTLVGPRNLEIPPAAATFDDEEAPTSRVKALPEAASEDRTSETCRRLLFELRKGEKLSAETLCDRLDVCPRRLRSAYEEARELGYVMEPPGGLSIPVTTADEIREHALKEQVRELSIARKRLLDELHDRDAQIGILGELRSAPERPIVAPRRTEGKRRIGTPVMLCSDWHVEEPVDPKRVNDLNEYSLSIADACVTRCAEAYEWLSTDARYDCREGLIWLGGDLFSGYIHEELVEQNFLSPVQAVVWLQERLERMLRQILATTSFELIHVLCNDGNHGRLTHKIRVGTRTANSLEWLLYKTMAARFANESRLRFQIADGEYNYIEIYGKTHCFFHGDSVNYQGGVGGLLIPMKRGLNELRKYREVAGFNFGHFHTRLDLPDISGNGSMIGITPYAMRLKVTPEPRQQSWYMLDSVNGKCLSAPVWL